jgi:hypothetical protein
MREKKDSQNEVVLRIKNVEGKRRPVKCLSQSSQSPHTEYNLLKEGCTQ